MKAMVFTLVMVAVAGLTVGHRHALVAQQPLAAVPAETRVLTGAIRAAGPTFAPAGVEVLLLVR
jgi:hypothetical protein